ICGDGVSGDCGVLFTLFMVERGEVRMVVGADGRGLNSVCLVIDLTSYCGRACVRRLWWGVCGDSVVLVTVDGWGVAKWVGLVRRGFNLKRYGCNHGRLSVEGRVEAVC